MILSYSFCTFLNLSLFIDHLKKQQQMAHLKDQTQHIKYIPTTKIFFLKNKMGYDVVMIIIISHAFTLILYLFFGVFFFFYYLM